MALSARSIITLNQAKFYLGITTSETTHDSTLEEWIDICSDSVERYVDNKINLIEVEEILDGTGKSVIYPHYFPIYAIYGGDDAEKLSNIQYRTEATGAWTNLLTDMDYVRIDPYDAHRIELLDGEEFTAGTKNIRIKYYAGYNDVPSDVKKVVMEMVAVMWNESNHGSNLIGRSSSTIGQGNQVSTVEMTPRWERVLGKYRRYAI